MDSLERIEAHSDLRGIKPGQHCSGIDHADCSQQNCDRPVETDRPAERLPVDDIDENKRERKSESESHEIREQTEQTSLDKNLLAHLAGCRAEKAEQAKFAAAVDDQSEQSTGDAHHRNNHGNGLERVGDGKGTVKYPDCLGAQIPIRKK